MLSAYILVAAAAASAAALTAETTADGLSSTVSVTMSAAKAAECKTTTCTIVTKKELNALVRAAIQLGREEVTERLDSNSCLRGAT